MKSKKPEILYEGHYLSLYRRGHWEYVERRNCEGAVMVVPVTVEGKVLLLEQFRPAIQARVIEWPAGLVNDLVKHQGEPWEKAAHRELIEETGYEAKEMKLLTKGPTSPGMSTEEVALYLAQGLKKIGPGGGDDHEDIIVHEVPLEEVGGWLKDQEKKGHPVDPKVYVGLYFLLTTPR